MTALTTPRLLTLPLIGYLLTDLLGMTLIAIGGLYLVNGTPLLLIGIPSTFLSSILFIIAGFILMFWALARVLVTVASLRPQQAMAEY